MLTTRKLYSDRMTREDAQNCADEWQRPVTVMTRTPSETLGTPEGRNRVRLRVKPRYRYFDDIRKRNAAAGFKWFEPDTMRFFSSRVQSTFYGAPDGRAYFVSSERGPSGRRGYSVRVANLDGSIDTVGEFQGYTTGRAAHAAAKQAAETHRLNEVTAGRVAS